MQVGGGDLQMGSGQALLVAAGVLTCGTAVALCTPVRADHQLWAHEPYIPPFPAVCRRLQADALGALHSLCQLSRSRQEQAAEQKAAGPLVAVALQQAPPPVQAQAATTQQGAEAAAAAWAASRGLAVSLLCAFGACC